MKINRTTYRATELLEYIANNPQGVTLTEAATFMDIPVTSLYNIVQALLKAQFLEINDVEKKTYVIGYKMYVLGYTYINNNDIVAACRDIMDELSLESGKTVFLGKKLGARVSYVYKMEPSNSVIKTCQVGETSPLHCTAIGKIFLSEDDSDFSYKDLIKITDNTLTTKKQLQEQYKEIRKNGYAIDIGECNKYLYGVAFPIRDYTGNVIAAICTSDIYTDNYDFTFEIDLLRKYANKVSQKLGYQEKN